MSQWNDMNEWKAQGFQGLDLDACPEAWHRIMRLLEEEHESRNG
jgi:hypothetical protein